VLSCILLGWSRLSSLRPWAVVEVVCVKGARGEKPAGGRKKWMCDRVGSKSLQVRGERRWPGLDRRSD
jgi:hypothetical protein